MRTFLLSIGLLLTSVANARCDFAVFSDAYDLTENARAEDIGTAFMPLCSSLPDYLRKGVYRRYCDNPHFDPRRVLYVPYDDYENCTGLIGQQWYVYTPTPRALIWSHQITASDLENPALIALHFPERNAVGWPLSK